MEGAWTDEVTDAGVEFVRDEGFWESVSLLFGDLDVTEFDADWPCDYDTAIQEPSLAELFSN